MNRNYILQKTVATANEYSVLEYVTDNYPLTNGSPRLLLTISPPSFSIRSCSSGRSGLWSVVNGTATDFRQRIALVSPTLAVCKCRFSLIIHTVAVVPEKWSISTTVTLLLLRCCCYSVVFVMLDHVYMICWRNTYAACQTTTWQFELW